MTAPKSDDPRLGTLIQPFDLAALLASGAVPGSSTHPAPCDVVILGFPHDEGCRRNGGRPGAQFGPASVRQFINGMGTVVNPELAVDLRVLRVGDAGDINGATLEEAHQNLRVAVRALLRHGSIPFVIGGSNDQSAPNGLALLDVLQDEEEGNVVQLPQGAGGGSARSAGAAVVNIDAHLDVRPYTAEGLAHSGTPFRQLLEDGRLPGSALTEFACQGNQCSAEHAKYVSDRGGRLMWWSAIRGDPVAAFDTHVLQHAVEQRRTLFVSFDIDAITGADCPGVSCPATFGLTSDHAMQMALSAGRTAAVRLFDVSEMNPVVEGYRTPRLVVNMLYHFLAGVAMRRAIMPR